MVKWPFDLRGRTRSMIILFALGQLLMDFNSGNVIIDSLIWKIKIISFRQKGNLFFLLDN